MRETQFFKAEREATQAAKVSTGILPGGVFRVSTAVFPCGMGRQRSSALPISLYAGKCLATPVMLATLREREARTTLLSELVKLATLFQ
jgi:hypothetical protein